ncbi:MAG: anaerobic ribonucleoside-triphosphate reductase activating protein [Venatoribacter sp.]
MKYSSEQIVWQEVPTEVSLAYTISGCPLRCPGCHSADTWPLGSGLPLTPTYFQQRLTQYAGLISCVLFLGGEWHEAELIQYLQLAKAWGLTTCLYSGSELKDISHELVNELTYLKVGPWRPELGGLDSPRTNQRFYDLRTGECVNHKFLQTAEGF